MDSFQTVLLWSLRFCSTTGQNWTGTVAFIFPVSISFEKRVSLAYHVKTTVRDDADLMASLW